MMVETMQFRDYIFPHNPAVVTVREPRATATHFCPGRGDVVQDLGPQARWVQCRGSFYGDSFTTALAQLLEFRQRAEGGGRGMLLVPGLAPFLACLSELVFDAEGDGRVIPYTMVFTEAGEGPG